MSLSEVLREQRLVVVVGPGGVGKTTVSAALALSAARMGRRVAVITIDPARRLAHALGLDELSNDMRRVTGDASGGYLDAAMIETRASYDHLVRNLMDAESAERILGNSVYQAFSRTLARSHAYVAMERLHDLVTAGAYDLIVLDTPPTRSALEILDAPNRLSLFLDEGVASWFAHAEDTRPTLARRSRRLAVRLLSVLASKRLVAELSSFLGLFFAEREGFAERAKRTRRFLASDDTAFLLVTTLSSTSLADARFIACGLGDRRIPLRAVLFNRAYLPHPEDVGRPFGFEEALQVRIPNEWAGTSSGDRERTEFETDLNRFLRGVLEDNRASAEACRSFLDTISAGISSIRLPELDQDLHDLRGLSRLARAWAPVTG